MQHKKALYKKIQIIKSLYKEEEAELVWAKSKLEQLLSETLMYLQKKETELMLQN